MSPDRLSGGLKNLIILYSKQYDIILPTHLFGDNCIPFLLEMSIYQDIILYSTSYFSFKPCCLNNTNIYLNDTEYLKESDYKLFLLDYIDFAYSGESYEGVFR